MSARPTHRAPGSTSSVADFASVMEMSPNSFFRRLALAVASAILLACIVMWVGAMSYALFEYYVPALVAALALSFPLREARVFLQRKARELRRLEPGLAGIAGYARIWWPVAHGDATMLFLGILVFSSFAHLVEPITLAAAVAAPTAVALVLLFIFGGSALSPIAFWSVLACLRRAATSGCAAGRSAAEDEDGESDECSDGDSDDPSSEEEAGSLPRAEAMNAHRRRATDTLAPLGGSLRAVSAGTFAFRHAPGDAEKARSVSMDEADDPVPGASIGARRPVTPVEAAAKRLRLPAGVGRAGAGTPKTAPPAHRNAVATPPAAAASVAAGGSASAGTEEEQAPPATAAATPGIGRATPNAHSRLFGKTPATQGSILTTMSEDVDSDRPTSTVRLRNRAAARSGRKLRDMELPQRRLRWGVSTPELPTVPPTSPALPDPAAPASPGSRRPSLRDVAKSLMQPPSRRRINSQARQFERSCVTLLLFLVGGLLVGTSSVVFSYNAAHEAGLAGRWVERTASAWAERQGLTNVTDAAMRRGRTYVASLFSNASVPAGANETGVLQDASRLMLALGINVSRMVERGASDTSAWGVGLAPASNESGAGHDHPEAAGAPLAKQAAAHPSVLDRAREALRELSAFNLTEAMHKAERLNVASMAAAAADVTQSVLRSTTGVLLTAVTLAMDLGFQAMVFAIILFFLVSAEAPPMHAALGILPLASHSIGRIRTRLSGRIAAVAILPFKRAICHAAVTFSAVSLAGAPGPHLAAAVACIGPFVPIVPAAAFWLPWVVAALLSDGALHAGLLAALIFVPTFLGDAGLDATQAEDGLSTYIQGLAVGMGFLLYGASGTVLGPLIFILAQLLFELVTMVGKPSAEDGDQDDDVVSSLASNEMGRT
uniref:Transmembrane protein 245 n=2 Tax=Cafeteria roenbergensis TaxID=33653 RepID=A0A7S0JQB0_CAFRO